MGRNCAQLLFVSLLLSSCICLALAQSGRARREKTNNPTVPGTESSPAKDAGAAPSLHPGEKASQPQIPLLVMLSRPRRLVMLPSANQTYAERIVKSLGRDHKLSVSFDPQKIKLEDAQKLGRGIKTYTLLVRFEEFEDRDDSRSCPEDKGRRAWVTSYKMDYTLLAPETRAVIKQRSIQTFFSCDRNAKPLPGPFVKNCLNRSRQSLDEPAVQCMTQHVLTDLYYFAGQRTAKKN
jgi:hypothetical protein